MREAILGTLRWGRYAAEAVSICTELPDGDRGPFDLPCKKWFCRQAAIVCQPMEKMMTIDVYIFGHEIFMIGIFWFFFYKYLKTIPV